MSRERKVYAPEPQPGEHPADYLLRVIEFLSQPHRRRMGEAIAASCRDAVKALDRTGRS